MNIIVDNKLASHGLEKSCSYPARPEELMHGQMISSPPKFNEWVKYWVIVDCRVLKDEAGNKLEDYENLIKLGEMWLKEGRRVVTCCGAGISRSNAIALGLLVKFFKYDYEEAYNLLRDRVHPLHIEPCHISAIQKVLKLDLPLELQVK